MLSQAHDRHCDIHWSLFVFLCCDHAELLRLSDSEGPKQLRHTPEPVARKGRQRHIGTSRCVDRRLGVDEGVSRAFSKVIIEI